MVGKDHRSSPTATHEEENQKSTPCNKFVTSLLPYVHGTRLANFNTSIYQFHNCPTSMTLRLPPLYFKTIINHQIDHRIQFTSYDSFYYTQLRCSLIRLRRIYNFLLFHANIIQLSYTFGNFLYYFWD